MLSSHQTARDGWSEIWIPWIMQTKYPPLLSADPRSHTLSSRVLILALVCGKSAYQPNFLLVFTWNSNRLQVTALWLLHLLSVFLASNVEKLKRYFLVYCPEWRVGSSPGQCPGPRATHRPVADSAPGGGHLETVLASPPPPTGTGGIRSNRASNKGSRRFHRESSWLKVPISVFTLKTLGAV